MTAKEIPKESMSVNYSSHPNYIEPLKSISGNSKTSLAPLKVVGPISTLITSVRVQGQLPGAEVVVFSLSDGQVKARGLATCHDQRFSLLPNLVLSPEDRLVAIQTLGNDSSTPLPEQLSVPVQQAPQSKQNIGLVSIEAYIGSGAISHLWVSGSIPGAMVEAFFGGKIQGRSISEEGIVRLTLEDKPPKGIAVSVYQIVKEVGSGPVSTITPEPKFGTFFGDCESYQYDLLAI